MNDTKHGGDAATQVRAVELTQGVVGRRASLVARKVSWPNGGDGSCLWLPGSSPAWLLLGIAVLSTVESAARRQGSLGRY